MLKHTIRTRWSRQTIVDRIDVIVIPFSTKVW